MEAITSAVQSVVTALTPNKLQPVAKNNTNKALNKVATNVKALNANPNLNTSPAVTMNKNVNRNNNIPANVRFEPGNRQNVYESFQSASAEGGARRKRRHTKKSHRKSKKRMAMSRRKV